MKVFLWPIPEQFPERGGVREHLRQVVKCMDADPDIERIDHPGRADLYHVESSWVLPTHFPKRPMVYVCHGGFLPQPLHQVLYNLDQADMIISVADWLIDKFFSHYAWKSVTIANGVDLDELKPDMSPTLEFDDYLVYGKEWDYYFDDVMSFAELNPTRHIVATGNIANMTGKLKLHNNLHFVGNHSHQDMMRILSQAFALLLTGSEVCPTMLLEAWALGIPVIAKNIDGSKELMKPNGHVIGGVLYDKPSSELVIEVADNYESLVKQGRAQVEALYQWKDLWQKYKTVYEQVL